MDTLDRDKEASDLQEQGLTWAAVAERMHYANGSVARRCAQTPRTRRQPDARPKTKADQHRTKFGDKSRANGGTASVLPTNRCPLPRRDAQGHVQIHQVEQGWISIGLGWRAFP